MRKQTIRHKMHNPLWVVLLLLSLSFSGCGSQKEKTAERPETEEIFCQILLFLQECFRQHDIRKTYVVYFSAPDEAYTNDDGNTVMHCDLLLEDTDNDGTNSLYWYENLDYTFDTESGWYTFTWQYGPVMTQDDSFAYDADSSHVEELLENSIYETTLSIDTVVEAPIRYYAPSGPFIFDSFFAAISPFSQSKTISDELYTYQDDRMGVSVVIHYPALRVSDSDLTKTLNARIRDAFFYGYNWNEEPNLLMPEREILASIERDYLVTREDAQYFSVCISEYNEVRRAAGPGEWKTGLTLSLETGEALTLRDIVGEKYTARQLLNSGAFHCMWGDLSDYLDEEWMAETDGEWMAEIAEHYQYWELEDFDTNFYLTDDSLGLIVTAFADEYICIEAKLIDLGLEEWIATPPADR